MRTTTLHSQNILPGEESPTGYFLTSWVKLQSGEMICQQRPFDLQELETDQVSFTRQSPLQSDACYAITQGQLLLDIPPLYISKQIYPYPHHYQDTMQTDHKTQEMGDLDRPDDELPVRTQELRKSKLSPTGYLLFSYMNGFSPNGHQIVLCRPISHEELDEWLNGIIESGKLAMDTIHECLFPLHSSEYKSTPKPLS